MIKASLLLACLLSLSSCCPFLPKSAARAYSAPRVAPYEKAINQYHSQFGVYPKDMATLASYSPEIASLQGEEHSQWRVHYTHVSPKDYRLSLSHSHYNVSYQNGKHDSTFVNCWR